jgi:hypothetical protein
MTRTILVVYWYDAAGRPTAEADVGANGGAAYVRPSAPPPASDAILLAGWWNNAGPAAPA